MLKIQTKKGFTLVEIVVVVAIMVIMAAIAIPLVMGWLPNMRLQTVTRDLFSNMQRAKVEATKLGINSAITFNQLVNGTTFVYIVYSDANANCEYDVGENIFAQLQRLPESVSFDPAQGGGDGLTFTNNDDGNPTIAFLPTTIPTANGGGLANGTAFLTNTSNRFRSVVVSRAGMIRINE